MEKVCWEKNMRSVTQASVSLFVLAALGTLTLAKRVVCAQVSQGSTGVFSRSATTIWPSSSVPKSLVIKSPDKQCALIAEYHPQSGMRSQAITVDLQIHGVRFHTNLGQLVNSEVQWSPDSKALAVTFSDGGDVGTYHTQIYWIEEHGFRVQEPTQSVKRTFALQKLVCFEPEPPNIGAIEWLGSSERIVVAAEIPPHSNCDNFGTFKAYEIRLPEGEILKVYGQIEAKHLFGPHLGPELANANDDCITKPGSCDIPQLHHRRVVTGR